VVTRSLAANPSDAIEVLVNANDTAYVDMEVKPGTTYVYTVKAKNQSGISGTSNKNVTATLSIAEKMRVKENLIAYYNFSYNSDYIVYDFSGYGDPLNLRVIQRSAVNWNDNNKLELLSNTGLISTTSARKLVNAIKQTNELTFECWVKPTEPVFSGKARIASLGSNDGEVAFIIDQDLAFKDEKKALDFNVRLQTASTSPNGYPFITPEKPQEFINLQHIAFVRDASGKEILYINGEISSENFRPGGFENWKDNFYLRLGNESDMNHGWQGTYYVVALYNSALNSEEIKRNYEAGPRDNIDIDKIIYDIKIYPNPVSEIANIEIIPMSSNDRVPQTSLRIIDINGKVLSSEYVFNPYRQISKTFDFSNYPVGSYFLQILSGKHQDSFKIIVSR